MSSPDPTTMSVSPAMVWRKFLPTAALVALAFSLPLWRLFFFASHDELYSYIILIPFVTGYLIYQELNKTPADSPRSPGLAILFSLAGAVLLACNWTSRPHLLVDSLSQTTLAFVCFIWAAASWQLGGKIMRQYAFALAMLIFMVPMPARVLSWVDTGLQYGSANVADVMYQLAMTPVVQEGLSFALPGMRLQVAPECSGIHSTMVLFITSLVAGYYFLNRPWKRAVLCLAIIPLALLRNGFRIFVIGELCVHISPNMINSVIHRHGGPLFFLLSLIPFFYLIKYLRKIGSPNVPGESKDIRR